MMSFPSRSTLRVGLAIAPTAGALAVLTAACSLTTRERAIYAPQVTRTFSAESYDRIDENPFLTARDNPLSTFSVDVDTASYANVRRFLNDGTLPPPDAVRLEELVNYFHYGDAAPEGPEAVTVHAEVGPCPWADGHRLLRLGVRARDLAAHGPPPPRNLTFLIDTSGSMDHPNKLPLVVDALGLLVDGLGERDRIAIVTYAGSAGLELAPTSGADKGRIHAALAGLGAGGSTNGGDGIQLAYDVAARGFTPGGVNRVVLATDGDFNVGVSSPGALLRLIERERERGIYLTVLGFGMGNLKDSTMEKLADRGNGNYAYIDSRDEARKVLVEDAAGTLITVAKDVKIQVEMNPATVGSYRLLGYENRLLRREQFADDREDAGDMGAGQTVTALYEIEPVGGGGAAEAAPLRYQAAAPLAAASGSGELASVAVRYKDPAASKSRALALVVRDGGAALAATSPDFRFAAAVVAFGLSLRASPHRGTATTALARELATGAGAASSDTHRRELLALIDQARTIAANRD